jgi:tRNA threonylcarbamoyladenosine biosynthesis protein TsaB
MAFILNIDSSSENASICLARDGTNMALIENGDQKDHASWMHLAIEKLLQKAGLKFQDLDAIAVTAGPGSYTGLRVSMSTAKGLCYALNISLLTENTLRVMAFAVKQSLGPALQGDILFCPMIDARRTEVFTALFDADLKERIASAAVDLTNHEFSGYLEKYQIIFSGNGSKKFQDLMMHHQAKFSDADYSALHLAQLSYTRFLEKDFTDIVYAEPLYLKEFYTASKK